MEAIAALSLACNILQLVDTGSKAASCFRQVYKDGNTKHNLDLKDVSQSLSESLKEGLSNIDSFEDDERELYITGCHVAATATSLQNLVEGSIMHGQIRTRDKLRNTFKTIRTKNEVEEIESKLQLYQKTLDTTILLNLRKRFILANVQNRQDFDSLNVKLRNFINTQAAIQRDEHQATREAVRDEGFITRTQIITKIDGLEQTRERQAGYQRLLLSLRFPAMNERQNSVDTAYDGTFRWLLEWSDTSIQGKRQSQEEPSTKENTFQEFWQNLESDLRRLAGYDQPAIHHGFTEWLRQGDDNYWISGKAGSGKSTLVRYILHHPSTKSLLVEWTGGKKLNIVQVYLWNAGSGLQKSYKGVLATILLQMLESNEIEAMKMMKQNHMISTKTHITDWHVKEIEEILIGLIKSSSERYCLFIDGLDELEISKKYEDDQVLLQFIQRISVHDNVKYCLASRPELMFESHFQNTPKLRLESLNTPDIIHLCKDVMQECLGEGFKRLKYHERRSLEYIARELIRKADGVFLWARLVLENIRRDLRHHTEIQTLLEYLNALPSDLVELYEHMWSKTNDNLLQYRREAANLFALAILATEHDSATRFGSLEIFNILQLALVLDRVNTSYDVHEFNEMSQRMKEFISWRSADLLVVRQRPSSENSRTLYDLETGVSYIRWNKIEFMHRTAQDFMLSTLTGQKIRSEASMNSSMLKEKLLLVLLQEQSFSDRPITMNWLGGFASLLRTYENDLAISQLTTIIDSLRDTCISSVKRHFPKKSSDNFLYQLARYDDNLKITYPWVVPIKDLITFLGYYVATKSILSIIKQDDVSKFTPRYCSYLLSTLSLTVFEYDIQLFEILEILVNGRSNIRNEIFFSHYSTELGSSSVESSDIEIPHAIGGSSLGIFLRIYQEISVPKSWKPFSTIERNSFVSLLNPLLASTNSLNEVAVLRFGKGWYQIGGKDLKVFPISRIEILIEYDPMEVLRWYAFEFGESGDHLHTDAHERPRDLTDMKWTISVHGILGPDPEDEHAVAEWRRPCVEDQNTLSNIISSLPIIPCPMHGQVDIDTGKAPWKFSIDQGFEIWGRSSTTSYHALLKEVGWLISVDDPRMSRGPPMRYIDNNEERIVMAFKDLETQMYRPLRSITGFSNDEEVEDDFVDAVEDLDSLSLHEGNTSSDN